VATGPLDDTLFPGAPQDIEVHEGFRNAQHDTAGAIMNETTRLIAAKGADNVVIKSTLKLYLGFSGVRYNSLAGVLLLVSAYIGLSWVTFVLHLPVGRFHICFTVYAKRAARSI
jgi:hypothetical protein